MGRACCAECIWVQRPHEGDPVGGDDGDCFSAAAVCGGELEALWVVAIGFVGAPNGVEFTGVRSEDPSVSEAAWRGV